MDNNYKDQLKREIFSRWSKINHELRSQNDIPSHEYSKLGERVMDYLSLDASEILSLSELKERLEPFHIGELRDDKVDRLLEIIKGSENTPLELGEFLINKENFTFEETVDTALNSKTKELLAIIDLLTDTYGPAILDPSTAPFPFDGLDKRLPPFNHPASFIYKVINSLSISGDVFDIVSTTGKVKLKSKSTKGSALSDFSMYDPIDGNVMTVAATYRTTKKACDVGFESDQVYRHFLVEKAFFAMKRAIVHDEVHNRAGMLYNIRSDNESEFKKSALRKNSGSRKRIEKARADFYSKVKDLGFDLKSYEGQIDFINSQYFKDLMNDLDKNGLCIQSVSKYDPEFTPIFHKHCVDIFDALKKDLVKSGFKYRGKDKNVILNLPFLGVLAESAKLSNYTTFPLEALQDTAASVKTLTANSDESLAFYYFLKNKNIIPENLFNMTPEEVEKSDSKFVKLVYKQAGRDSEASFRRALMLVATTHIGLGGNLALPDRLTPVNKVQWNRSVSDSLNNLLEKLKSHELEPKTNKICAIFRDRQNKISSLHVIDNELISDIENTFRGYKNRMIESIYPSFPSFNNLEAPEKKVAFEINNKKLDKLKDKINDKIVVLGEKYQGALESKDYEEKGFSKLIYLVSLKHNIKYYKKAIVEIDNFENKYNKAAAPKDSLHQLISTYSKLRMSKGDLDTEYKNILFSKEGNFSEYIDEQFRKNKELEKEIKKEVEKKECPKENFFKNLKDDREITAP